MSKQSFSGSSQGNGIIHNSQGWKGRFQSNIADCKGQHSTSNLDQSDIVLGTIISIHPKKGTIGQHLFCDGLFKSIANTFPTLFPTILHMPWSFLTNSFHPSKTIFPLFSLQNHYLKIVGLSTNVYASIRKSCRNQCYV